MSVSRDASSPPVQLSAVASFKPRSHASRRTNLASSSTAGGKAGSRASAICLPGLLDGPAQAVHLPHERFLAGLQLFADGLEVHLGLLDLREVLLLLFLHVVLDQFLQHRDLGVVELLAGLHAFDL